MREEVSVPSLQGVELLPDDAGERLPEESAGDGSLGQAAGDEVNVKHGLIHVLQLLPVTS